MKKNLKLDFLDEQPEKKIENYIESDFTQLLENQINFFKEKIKIDTKGIEINNKLIPCNFKEKIIIEKCIGIGSTAKVHKVHLKTDPKKKFAMKIINIYEKQNRVQMINDIKNYMQVPKRCPFLLNFYGGYFEKGNVKLFLEYMDGGNLKTLIKSYKKKKKRIPEKKIKKITEQILHGLAFIHLVNYQVHLDIKPENILLNSKNVAKISDFGIAKFLDHTKDIAKTFMGTFYYMSPERLMNLEYCNNVDIWALGVMLYEMCLLEFPFKDCGSYIDLVQFFKNYKNVVGKNVGKFYSSNLVYFLKLCLIQDPAKRPNSGELITHRWFFE